MTDDEMITAARRAIKTQGCLCKVDITLNRPDPEAPLYVEATALHDNWCPLFMARQRASN